MFEFDWFRSAPHMNMDGAGGGGSVESGGGASSTPPAADAGGGGSAEPTIIPGGAMEQAAPAPKYTQNPLRAAADPAAPVAPVIPAAAPVVPPAPEVYDFAGRQIAASDPNALKTVHEDYGKLNKSFTQSSQRVKELEGKIAQFEAQQNAVPPAPAATPPAPPTPEALTPEQIEARSAEIMDKWYANPEATMTEMVQKLIDEHVKPVIEPIQKERQAAKDEQQVVTRIGELQQQYGDFDEMRPAMLELINSNPLYGGWELGDIYHLAKGKQASSAPPAPAAPTPEQFLSDPNFLQQHVYGNEAIRNHMLSTYIKSVQSGQAQTPPVVGSQSGGRPPMMPENRPRTIGEGTKGFLASLGIRKG